MKAQYLEFEAYRNTADWKVLRVLDITSVDAAARLAATRTASMIPERSGSNRYILIRMGNAGGLAVVEIQK